MVQYHIEIHRFTGNSVIPFKDGQIAKQVMRIGSLFAEIFAMAVDNGVMQGLLVPLGNYGDAGEGVGNPVEAAGAETKH